MRFEYAQKRQASEGALTTISGALQLTHKSGVNLDLTSEALDLLIAIQSGPYCVFRQSAVHPFKTLSAASFEAMTG